MAPIAEALPCRRPVGTARRKLARSEDTSTPASPMMASRCLDKNFNVQNRPDCQRTYWPNPWGTKLILLATFGLLFVLIFLFILLVALRRRLGFHFLLALFHDFLLFFLR